MDSEFKTGDDIFCCTQCGECCSGYGGTYVTMDDIKKIAEYLDVTQEQFISNYCDKSGKRVVLTQGKDGKCLFFNKNCSIHPVKPYMCRAWPFIKAVVTNPENWNAMAGSCQGIKKNIPADTLKKIVSKEMEKLKFL
ncbi:MAG: YkgJ family cysteine cluster protein [Thermodesulfobacteriota bacterium]|nr:YkgJ family cysteine cluster protein [Thermodesulfobacteriota bacterium]